MFGQDAGPEAKAGVVAQFRMRETELGHLAEKGGTIIRAIGVPTGGKGEGRHRCEFR